MTVKTSISLTDQQAAFARKLVDEGRYSSLSSVVQQALEAMRMEDEDREAELAVMRAFFEERAKGPSVSLEEFRKSVDEMLEEESRLLGLED